MWSFYIFIFIKMKKLLILAIFSMSFLILSWCNKDQAVESDQIVKCMPEQRNVDACIEIYKPVCATVNVQCITTPCEPIKQTFENSCKACDNSLVSHYVEGECEG